MARKLIIISLRIPENLAEEIDNIAKIYGIYRSELIRKAIKQYIEKLKEHRDKITSNPPNTPERTVKLYI